MGSAALVPALGPPFGGLTVPTLECPSYRGSPLLSEGSRSAATSTFSLKSFERPLILHTRMWLTLFANRCNIGKSEASSRHRASVKNSGIRLAYYRTQHIRSLSAWKSASILGFRRNYLGQVGDKLSNLTYLAPSKVSDLRKHVTGCALGPSIESLTLLQRFMDVAPE